MKRIKSAARTIWNTAPFSWPRQVPAWLWDLIPKTFWTVVSLGLVAIVLLGLVLVWWVPEHIGGTDPAAVNDARDTFAPIFGGGVLLVVGGITAWLTLRRVNALERTVIVAEQGQITERYTRAIDHIGAYRPNNEEAIEIRIGGLFALERIARESPTDYWAVADVIAAYLRMHARDETDENGEPLDPPAERKPDVQAAVQVLRSLQPPPGERSGGLDLSGADLREADLTGAHLEGARLEYAHLEGARLWFAHLEGAWFGDAHLERARFLGAHLEGAWFDRRWEAMLRDAGVHGFDEINWHGEDEDEAAAPEGTSPDPSDETP